MSDKAPIQILACISMMRYSFRYATSRPILEPEILGNHNINTGTTLLLKTIVN